MATSAKGGSNSNKGGGFSSYSDLNTVDVGNRSESDSLAYLLIVILVAILMGVLPLVAWMLKDSQNNLDESKKLNADTRKMHKEISKMLKKAEKEHD